MKTLVINETDRNGVDTTLSCHATTLRNAFKKAGIRKWQHYRIYQVNGDRAPLILFESIFPKEKQDCDTSVELGD